MNNKLMNLGLAALMSGVSLPALAQDQRIPASDPGLAGDDTTVCSEDGCTDDGDLVFRLRTRSYAQPATVGTSQHSPSEALQPDRRVTIAAEPAGQPGQATALGKFSVSLPDGGVIWATEDPTLGQPELSVSAPSMVPYDGTRITEPVRFFVRGNYPGFIRKLEISIYRSTDADLIEPLAVIPLDVAAVTQASWDGALPGKYRFRTGDDLIYVLRAHGEDGAFDETVQRRLQLVRPEDAARNNQILRRDAEKSLGTALTAEQARTQALINDVFSGNGLRQQNIAIRGSRIRIQGRNLPPGAQLAINGESWPVDLERKFAAEYLAPVGRHAFDIALQGAGSEAAQHHRLDIDVTGRYFFGVGIADLTISQNDISGSVEPFAGDMRADDDILADGRLAFYLKSKLGGRYLITAQADTTERDLGDLFKGFGKADPQDIFRRLDPDLYYPVYGDDSTTYRDVDTMGRFYLRVDWDKNQALWGNYQTGITGTDYAQYIRSLYGAALNWRSNGNNPWGDPQSELRVFGSQAQTAPGHNEFIGTGGSLYYLRHTDLLPGSDIVYLEIRDRTTGRAENRVQLTRGADYEIDELQGRIILTRPLAQITRENAPSLTRDAPLDGFEQRLIVDYEWLPGSFDSDEITAGFRGKHWLGDHLGIGATYVDENRAGDDYTLYGGDITLRAGRGTYLKGEFAHTQALAAPTFLSTNGGFDFTRLAATGPQEGDARSIEARANFTELGLTALDWSAGAWWRETDAGYSTGRYNNGLPTTEYGGEVLGQLAANLGVYARYSKAESGTDSLLQAQASLDWRLDDANAIAAEIRRVEENSAYADAAGMLGAVKYSRRIGTALDLYAQGQLTLDDDAGRYRSNDMVLAGGRYLLGDQSSLGAEISTGDRGDAATVDAEYRLAPDHTLYGAYTYSTDTTQYENLLNPNRRNGWTLGQRWRVSDQVNLFNESQYLKEPAQSGLAHTYGLDFYPARGWSTGFTIQTGELRNQMGGIVDRRAVSLRLGRTSPDTDWQSKLEWRRDTGAERRRQWVTTNRITHRIDESWRVAARFNYSDTTDAINPLAGARFVEGNVGFAWRPWNNTRWGVFGRYTYLYDLATMGQEGGAEYDQRSHVLSLEGVHRLDRYWEFAAKIARREGEARMGRGTGEWFDSATTFVAAQVRYELLSKWHALAEYRALDVADGGIRHGALVGIDRDVASNLRIGIGYNFTRFSDDLTDLDYDNKGFFINLVGRY
ncbi:hypothetical protein FHS61_002947 [Altererythrobacter atlanticus]|uniref:Uncharacterized protein n=1 Tax=Croceibacterium atlanticum TaxID=1267766 RepID=A0A0F7KYK3_9SPHN|nr:hypothetical protein [Croceibacterium atlanticum]AKH44317.1 hypothetical protein WYH_03298 [Croceibacterium atlanticum]MBB5733900.1 hypothetical protein [Croceibacterium atlanticum]